MRRLYKISIALILVAIISALYVGFFHKRVSAPARSDATNLKLLQEVLGHIKGKYVEEVDQKKLVQGAIDGMLATLDPHSNYLPPEPFKEMNVQISGSFGGLGIELTIKDGKLTVVAPIEGTPAERAGIKANDHIYKIDSKQTKGLNINDSVKLMRGEKGTSVTLTILREGNGKPLVFPLVRDIINVKSMRSRTIAPGFGYIRIAQFQSRTGEEFKASLVKLREQNNGSLKGLVIDLRNNPGGLVDQAAKVADCFIGDALENGLIVYTQGRAKESRQNLSAYVSVKEPHYPIVVLMNGGSASASEILAGALQDHKRAIVMGTQSFGKGSVQSIYSLKGGAGLKLTTARYYTPNGRSIQVKGITPDIVVSQLRQENHTSARRAESEFREANLDRHLMGGGMPHMPPKPKQAETSAKATEDAELAKDFQLSRAVGLLQGLNQFAEYQKQVPAAATPAATPAPAGK
jgi:carboxyl-terminal processing protease